ncbi:hypothetical protein PFICI_09275 [Pestalotiopsis fici W106-1]|uniref:Uncharacterized protein n=1 Tax=Pestalotiopsis fici (strain W106-1 / CGMCC3.15140) TaxID=1229662 RepID=W3X222_PESFW|nr:uncharacterized protein PFICI_09275 [Pestalotiopsis fici W106-1]ETS79422.1 hypothetical protein PFICI_09275 [Pestalotiopsis fici W106-1]
MSYQPQEPTEENGGKGKDRVRGPIIQGKRYALPPDPHMPERRQYADRSNTTLLSKTEMAAKSKQMDSHPSAKSFRIKAAEAAAKSKPAPGRMRSEEDPAVRKKDEAM